MDNLLADMDILIDEIASIDREYQRMADETEAELELIRDTLAESRPLHKPS